MERLDFDSDLFGIRVFSATGLPDASEMEECDLLYLFTSEDVPSETLARFNGSLVDRRFTYMKVLVVDEDTPAPGEARRPSFETVDERKLPASDRKDLHDLAIQSGHRCRFRNDPMMPEGWFELMYRTWMDNSLNGTAADLVVAARIDGRYRAMATLRREDGDAAGIGLIAVDRGLRGVGLGRAVIEEAALRCLRDLDRSVCKADTHGDDPAACAFYEAMGFKLADRVNVYHLWPAGAPT